MNVKRDLIPKGRGVRTGKKLTKLLGLVVHWIGVPQGHAAVIRRNFASSSLGAHYISDWYDGHIIQCVPEDEVCYHVGSSYGYTALKTRLCGDRNPNWYFAGIECCIDPATVIPADYSAAGKYLDLGKPSDKQYEALVEFAADFLKRHGLSADKLYRHYDITGKCCHAWFVKEEARWARFKADVAARMGAEAEKGEEMKVYHWFADMPAWARESAEKAYKKGILSAGANGAVDVYECNLQALAWLDRLGLLE